jgi:hypothetical protein
LGYNRTERNDKDRKDDTRVYISIGFKQ